MKQSEADKIFNLIMAIIFLFGSLIATFAGLELYVTITIWIIGFAFFIRGLS